MKQIRPKEPISSSSTSKDERGSQPAALVSPNESPKKLNTLSSTKKPQASSATPIAPTGKTKSSTTTPKIAPKTVTSITTTPTKSTTTKTSTTTTKTTTTSTSNRVETNNQTGEKSVEVVMVSSTSSVPTATTTTTASNGPNDKIQFEFSEIDKVLDHVECINEQNHFFDLFTTGTNSGGGGTGGGGGSSSSANENENASPSHHRMSELGIEMDEMDKLNAAYSSGIEQPKSTSKHNKVLV